MARFYHTLLHFYMDFTITVEANLPSLHELCIITWLIICIYTLVFRENILKNSWFIRFFVYWIHHVYKIFGILGYYILLLITCYIYRYIMNYTFHVICSKILLPLGVFSNILNDNKKYHFMSLRLIVNKFYNTFSETHLSRVGFWKCVQLIPKQSLS